MDVDFSTLAIVSVLTTLSTEGIKTLLKRQDMNYISNIIAAVMAVVIAAVLTVVKPLVVEGVPFSPILLYNWIVMAFFGVLCATLSFDKIKQVLDKIK